MTQPIVIVGAGVIGLTCAYQLVLKGYTDVTVIAKDFPSTGLLKPEYTSSKSGAHFRPFPSKTPEEFRDSRLTRSTYDFFKKLGKEHPESSVKWVQATDYLEFPDPLYMTIGKGYADGIDDFHLIRKEDLPSKVVFGATYTTWCINSPVYLDFLENQLRMKYGIPLVQSEVSSLKQVADKFPGSVIINCTGMGLQYDGSWDPDCYHIRGQILLVRPPLNSQYKNRTVTHQLANGEWSFVIPRPLDGGIIVGGTKVENDENSEPNPLETAHLIKNAHDRFPDLLIDGRSFDIRKISVGFRPARKGGVKIATQTVGGTRIIDCYGFGGSGMEMSWGAGQKVVELIERRNRCKL
ncbi:DEKNAAC104534 [Brettanomyces naardenensis]|uniref:DEKNAAC104534 n=1 Tax=Brettanomyces naardenensis TaxID=13370 RepID=A0A448YRL4_BRENA|nr:DEKNAAC104534 [Brettanomyces naardenensis]